MTRSPWFKGSIAGLVAGLAVASFAVFAALDHNPQGEFRRAGALQLGPLLAVGARWLVAVGVPMWLGSGAFLALLSRRRRHHAD